MNKDPRDLSTRSARRLSTCRLTFSNLAPALPAGPCAGLRGSASRTPAWCLHDHRAGLAGMKAPDEVTARAPSRFKATQKAGAQQQEHPYGYAFLGVGRARRTGILPGAQPAERALDRRGPGALGANYRENGVIIGILALPAAEGRGGSPTFAGHISSTGAHKRELLEAIQSAAAAGGRPAVFSNRRAGPDGARPPRAPSGNGQRPFHHRGGKRPPTRTRVTTPSPASLS